MRTTRAAVTRDLLSGLPESGASVKTLAAGAVLLKGFAATEAPALLKALERVLAKAPNYGAYETKTDRQIPVVRLTLATR